jgi:hypothetical protein
VESSFTEREPMLSFYEMKDTFFEEKLPGSYSRFYYLYISTQQQKVGKWEMFYNVLLVDIF